MKRALILLSIISALAFGCADTDSEMVEAADTNIDEQQTEVETETGLSPEELGRLSAEITHDPDNRQQILSERGLTEEQFEEQIRETAADPQASEQYAQAFREEAPES